eukprot:215969-Prymnesium_polylepis.1
MATDAILQACLQCAHQATHSSPGLPVTFAPQNWVQALQPSLPSPASVPAHLRAQILACVKKSDTHAARQTAKREAMLALIEQCVEQLGWHDVEVAPFGSTITGLSTIASDLDFALLGAPKDSARKMQEMLSKQDAVRSSKLWECLAGPLIALQVSTNHPKGAALNVDVVVVAD